MRGQRTQALLDFVRVVYESCPCHVLPLQLSCWAVLPLVRCDLLL